MAGHFETIPRELEEAAQIDVASAWVTFRHVALPLARPGIVVAFILSFIFSWNNFVFGAVLSGRETRTLPVAVYNVLTFEQLAWGPLAAAAIIVTLPVLLLTIIIQKEIVVGLTHGGVKGADGSEGSIRSVRRGPLPEDAARAMAQSAHVGGFQWTARCASRPPTLIPQPRCLEVIDTFRSPGLRSRARSWTPRQGTSSGRTICRARRSAARLSEAATR